MSKIRVSFVASTFAVGGLERVMFELITRLPGDRYDKQLYFLRKPGALGRAIFRAGVEGAEQLQKHRFDPLVVGRLGGYFRRRPPDILFLVDHHNALLWGRFAGLLERVPRQVVASHTTGRMGGRKSFRGRDRWLMEFTDRVVALSGAHARYLVEAEGIDTGKIAVVENGIDVAAYAQADPDATARLGARLGLSASDRVVIMVAALRPEKAHDALLSAARLLVATHRNLKFLVVGDGARRERLEKLSARLGLTDHVLFLGVRSDVAQLLHLADVLVLPSHPAVETLPMCVLEAMAAGVPVVASRVGSIPEVIEHGKNGLLIEPADPNGLAEGITSVIDRPELARAIASRAREVVATRYSVDTMVNKYAALFERLVAV